MILVGRRKGNLASFVQKHGHDKAEAYPFDITKLEMVSNFAAGIVNSHPDLDYIVLNSGIQRGLDFSKPETVDMDVVSEELTTNYLSYLALTKAFMPFLQAKQTKSALVFVTSGLALVPSTRCPNYCASKAALHHFILCLREQVKRSKVKVIELLPPAVQTELHEEKHQPDIKNGSAMGMPLDMFTDQAYKGLSNDEEQIPIGMAQELYEAFEHKRQEAFARMVTAMGGAP